MTEENPKFDFRIFLKREKSTKKEKTYNVNIEKPFNIDNLLKAEKPVFVKMKENLIDQITKFSALAAVLLAFFTVMFNCSQSIKQDKTFTSFQQKLDSTFKIQLVNAEKQHQKTIGTLEKQQDLMKAQNDSTIKLLKTQADRLKVQNEIWKIDQKNKIHTERVKISPSITDPYLRNDTIKLKFNYSNTGQRVAIDIECNIAIFEIRDNYLLVLDDERASFSMNKIIPGNTVFWKINKDFPLIIGERDIYIYSSLSYWDEMYLHKFVTTEFIRVFNKDKKTDYSFCQQNQIDFIEKYSKFKDIEIEDYTIKEDKFFR